MSECSWVIFVFLQRGTKNMRNLERNRAKLIIIINIIIIIIIIVLL